MIKSLIVSMLLTGCAFLPVRTTKFLERRFLRREITRRLDDCRFDEIGKV